METVYNRKLKLRGTDSLLSVLCQLQKIINKQVRVVNAAKILGSNRPKTEFDLKPYKHARKGPRVKGASSKI